MKNILGQKFGRLEVIASADSNSCGQARWSCRCECGGECVVVGGKLRSGHTQSCGCLQSERTKAAATTHALSGHPLYFVWKNMMARCFKRDNPHFRNWGGRGITVCDKWRTLEGFIEDMFPSFRSEMSIDRIDNDGNYEPSNCRWATKTQQGRNTRRSIVAETEFGSFQIGDASERFGISKKVLDWRVRKGWSPQRMLQSVVRKCAGVAVMLALAFIVSGCSDMQYNAVAVNGSSEAFRYRSLGGSSAIETAGGTRVTQNHVKSFGQGAQAVTSIAGGISLSVARKSDNALKATQDANAAATTQAKIAADAAAAESASRAALIDKAIVPSSVVPTIPPLNVP